MDIISGLFSIHASQLEEHEALARKTVAAFINTLSIAEYVYNQPEISGESKTGLHYLKLDLVALWQALILPGERCMITC